MTLILSFLFRICSAIAAILPKFEYNFCTNKIYSIHIIYYCFHVLFLQGKCLMASFWFAVLLNLKHIFIYVAPAYFVYLLRSYCFLGAQSSSLVQWRSFSPARFAKLGLVVAYVFLVSFGPFIVLNQLPQVINIYLC